MEHENMQTIILMLYLHTSLRHEGVVMFFTMNKDPFINKIATFRTHVGYTAV